MKVRKLAVALALAGGLGSGVAQALGLGEIELQSYLNEPLDAEINLRKSSGVDPDDVFVNIASESDYQRVGINRNYFLTKLQFEVTTDSDGSLVVNVSSTEALREPYLNFLLEVTWPNGRLMREYAVLVDPPVYAEESGLREDVAAPSTQRAAEPGRQAAQPRRTTTPARTQPNTLGPTSSSDTLWNIASQVRPTRGVSTQQVMLAIQDLNPDAFMGGNINRLKRGEILRIPDLEQIRTRTRDEAVQQVAAQNEAFSAPRRQVDATEQQAPPGPAAGESAQQGDELRLVTAEEPGTRDATEGGSAGGDGGLPGGADAGTAVAMEELESARRENEELSGRVDDLQEQVETLQRLLELKDSQLAEMQQMEQAEDQAAEDVEPEQSAEDAEPQPEADSVAPEDVDVTPADEDLGTTGQDVADEADDVSPEDMDETPVEGVLGEGGTEAVTDAEESQAATEDTAPEAEAVEPAEDATEQADEPAQQPAQDPAAAAPDQRQQAQDKGFPGNIIDAISNNPVYQVALGGGLVLLLLLLLLLARRNANREKAFYEQLNSETEGDSDSFDLTLEEEGADDVAADDPLAEADAYISYGRLDQAAQTLENAISREPSNSALRLKLLGVYADMQDRESFEKQFREVEALQEEDAIAEATALRARLEEAESMPSIDDLESQLRSDSYGGASETTDSDSWERESDISEETLADQYEAELPEGGIETPDEEIELPEDEVDEYASLDTELADLEPEETSVEEEPSAGQKASADDLIEYDLSGIETGGTETESAGDDELSDSLFDTELSEKTEESESELESEPSLDLAEGDLDLDETSLESETESPKEEEDFSFDFEELESTTEEPADAEVPDDKAQGSDEFDALDESFLDDLDAELDKVAGEEPATEDVEDALDDLELDVSDDDLALMEQFADSADSADGTPGPEGETSLEDELGLEDAFANEEPNLPEENLEGLETLDEELPIASDELTDEPARPAVEDLEESDLGEDDDFDFLAGTDEASTKLDLARAYLEMGDIDGARDILEEVSLEGNDEQKAEALELLKNLS